MSLSNEQYDAIMREYDALQREHEREAREKKRRLYAAIPQLSVIDDEITSLSISHARERIAGTETMDGAELHQQLLALSEEKQQLIKDAGFTQEDIEPHYRCRDCKDTGFAGGEYCHCFRQKSMDLIFENSSLPAAARTHTFRDFSLEFYPKDRYGSSRGPSAYDAAANARKLSEEFVNGFGNGSKNLLFYGETGVGKTFLSGCIANGLIASGHVTLYLSAFSLFEILSQGMFAKGNPPDTYRNLFSCDALIIDDLGTEFFNSMTNSQLFTLLNERILHEKSTVISTNLALEQIKEIYTERIFSRFMEHYQFIHLFGNDIRLQKKLAQQRPL